MVIVNPKTKLNIIKDNDDQILFDIGEILNR